MTRWTVWEGGVQIRSSNGTVFGEIHGGWEVLDSIRYYDPAAVNGIRFNADLCYENFNGRTVRSGTCDAMTNYGSIQGIQWNDTRSAYRGVHRGQYMNPPRELNNAGGSSIYYTDVYGNNATATPRAGAVKQYISPVSTRVNWSLDPRNILRQHNDGNGSVHAPN